jgi:hypothetical protein
MSPPGKRRGPAQKWEEDRPPRSTHNRIAPAAKQKADALLLIVAATAPIHLRPLPRQHDAEEEPQCQRPR